MRCKPYDNTRNKLLAGKMKIKGKEYTLDLIVRSGEILLSKNNFNDVRNVINSIQNYAQAKYKLPNSIQLFSLEDAREFKNQGYKALFLNKKSFEQLEKYMDRYEEAKIKVQNQVKEDPKFERDLEFFNQDIALLEQEQRELDQFRDEIENNLDNYSPNIVDSNFKASENIENNQIQYQLPQGREIEEFVASEKTIRDIAARMSDRIGVPVVFESDRSKKYKGKLVNNIAVINLAYATLDTPIHEILGHPIIRSVKNSNTQLYQNLVKELEDGKGKEVLDSIKKNYGKFEKRSEVTTSTYENNNTIKVDGVVVATNISKKRKYFSYTNKEGQTIETTYTQITPLIQELKNKYGKKLGITNIEEVQEEALVELLGLYTAGKLDNVKDGKLISLLKRLLKEMKDFMRGLINQKEVNIDKLPDNMTLGDIANLLAYSNSKLILPGNEVVYITPDNQQFKTYAEASKHISTLIKRLSGLKDSDLDIDLNLDPLKGKIDPITGKKIIKSEYIPEKDPEDYETRGEPEAVKVYFEDGTSSTHYKNLDFEYNYTQEQKAFYNLVKDSQIKDFIEKNKKFEQSKEIIKEWKRINNIQYNPEEVYSRGQEFVSVLGAYSDFDVNLMLQNLLQHIEDNQKAGGEFTISAFTKPVDKKIRHLEGGGGKIKFKIYPQSDDIKWAANTDVYSGSVWDAPKKVNKDKKSELLGVSYTKYPSLNNVISVQTNLASTISNLAHHHNELGISLTGSNFRLEYDEDIPYSTKKIIDSINSILDQKYGKLVKPNIDKIQKQSKIRDWRISKAEVQDGVQMWALEYTSGDNEYDIDGDIDFFTSEQEAKDYINKLIEDSKKDTGIQPTQTDETLKESLTSVAIKIREFQRLEHYEKEYNTINSKREKVLMFTPKSEYDSHKHYAVSIEQAKTKDWWIEDYYTVEDITEKTNELLNKKTVELKARIDNIKKEYKELTGRDYKLDFDSQAIINTKIAKLKEVAKKYPRSLIRSEVKNIINNIGFNRNETVFQKVDNSLEEESFNYSPVVTEEGKEFDTDDINNYKNAYVEYFTYKNALLNQNKKYLFDVSVEINKTDDPVKKAELIDIKQELRDAIYGNESKSIVGLINEMSELEENKKIYNELLDKRDKLETSLKKLEDEGLDTSFVLEALKDIAIDLYKFKNENLTSILRANSLSDLSRAEKLIETNKLENLVKAKQIINFYISVNPNNQDVNNPYYSREELLSGKIDSSIIQELYDISNKAASLQNKINNSSRKSIINYINSLEYFTKANENKPYTEEEIFNDKSGLLDISLIDQMVFNIQDNPFSKVQSILQTAIFKNVKDSLSSEEARVKEITDELDEKNPLVVKELVKLGHTIGESDSKSLLDKIKYKTLGKLSEAPDFSIFKQISKNGLQKNTLVQRYSDKYTSFMKEVKNKKDRDLNNVLTGKDTNKTVEGVYRAYYNNIRQSSEIIKPHLIPEIVTDEKYKDLLDELTTKEVNDNYKNYIISKIGEQGYKDILEEQKKQLDNYILTKERRIQTARFNYALVEKKDPDEVSLADLPEDVQEDLANWEVDNNPFYNGLLFDENRRVRIGEGRFNNYELDYSLFLPRTKEVKLKYKKNYSDSVSHSLRLIKAEETNVDTGYLDERYKYIEDNPVLYDFWKTSMKLSKYYQESLKSEELENWEDGDLPIDDKVFIDKFMETSDSISDKILMYISKFYRDILKRVGTSISSTMDLPYSNYNYDNTTLSVNDASLNVGNRTINNEIKLKEIQLRQYLESQNRKFKEVLFLETIPTDLKKEALFLYGTNSSKISKMSDSEVNAEFINAFKLTGKQFKDLNNQPITRYSANILEILKDLHIQNAIKESKSDLGLTLLKSASLASGIIARKKNLDMIQFMVDAFNNIKVVESNSFGTILTNKLTGNKVIAGESRKRAVSQMESFVKNVLTLRSKGNDNSLLASKEKAENLEYGFFNKYILNNGKDLELIDELLQNRDISEEDKEQLLKIKLSKIRYFDSIKGLLRPISAQFRFISLAFKTFSNFVNLSEGSKQLLIHDATGQDWEPGKITEALGIMKGAVLRNATQFIDKGLTNGKSVTPQATKARFIIDRLDFIEDASSLEAKALKKDTTTGIAKEALNAFNPYILIKKIEYVNQGSVALAMLMSEKIKDNKGNESSVWDALDNKGKLKPEFRYDENLINTWEKLNTQEALNFKAKLNSARNKTSGDYSQLGESQLNEHWSGKLILNFKKWMPKYIAQMYGNYRYDYDSGKYVKGRLKSLHPAELMLYRISSAARLKGFGLQTLFVIPLITMDFLSYTRDLDPNKPLLTQSVNRLQMLTKVALKTTVGLPINFISTGLFTNKPVINISDDKIFGKSLEQKLLNQGVKPEDIGNIKAIGVEIGINMIVTGVLILLTGLLLSGDDDEEEPEKHFGYTKKEWGTIMHNTLFPIIQQGEVFYSDPIKAFTTINSIPIYNYYEQLEKSAKSIDRVLRGQDRDYIARGRDAGKYKTAKLLSKLIPIPMRDLESRRYIKFEDYQVATQLTEDKDKLLDKNISNARSEIKNNLKKEITEDNIVSMYQEYGVEYDDVDKEGNLIPFKKLEKRLLNKIMREKFPTPNKGDKEKAYEDLEKVIDGDLDEETWLNKYYDKDLD